MNEINPQEIVTHVQFWPQGLRLDDFLSVHASNGLLRGIAAHTFCLVVPLWSLVWSQDPDCTVQI